MNGNMHDFRSTFQSWFLQEWECLVRIKEDLFLDKVCSFPLFMYYNLTARPTRNLQTFFTLSMLIVGNIWRILWNGSTHGKICSTELKILLGQKHIICKYANQILGTLKRPIELPSKCVMGFSGKKQFHLIGLAQQDWPQTSVALPWQQLT